MNLTDFIDANYVDLVYGEFTIIIIFIFIFIISAIRKKKRDFSQIVSLVESIDANLKQASKDSTELSEAFRSFK